MIGRLFNAIHKAERRFASSFGDDISTPWTRFTSQLHFQFMDHAILRHLWTNFDRVADGVYRSNQPNLRRLRRMQKRGITTVLNLRGTSQRSHYLFEKENCDKLGLTLVSVAFNARYAPNREELIALIALFPTLDRPFVLHCKSGADRAGFISAVYLLTQENAPLSEARKHLSFRYLHLKSTATGILDHVLDLYEPHEAEMGFAQWVDEHYNQEAAQSSFDANRAKPKS